MIASAFIFVVSCGLLVYWFRYTCILLVQNQERPQLASAVQATFRFAEIQDRLRTGAQLDPLHALIERDYQVLTYLVQHATGLGLESFEERLLVWDYRLMQVWYSLTRAAAPEQARAALREMATVLDFLAVRVGERAGAQTQA